MKNMLLLGLALLCLAGAAVRAAEGDDAPRPLTPALAAKFPADAAVDKALARDVAALLAALKAPHDSTQFSDQAWTQGVNNARRQLMNYDFAPLAAALVPHLPTAHNLAQASPDAPPQVQQARGGLGWFHIWGSLSAAAGRAKGEARGAAYVDQQLVRDVVSDHHFIESAGAFRPSRAIFPSARGSQVFGGADRRNRGVGGAGEAVGGREPGQ